MELSSKDLKTFLGAESVVTDTFNLILQSEENEGFCYQNDNDIKVSYHAGAKLLLCKWCTELSLDSSKGLERLNLTEYVSKIELTKMRLCVCSKCPTVNGLTLRNCGPEAECNLSLMEKKALLGTINPEVTNNLKVESLLNQALENPSEGMSSILFNMNYKGVVRPNICGCGNCSSRKVYLSLDEVANHVTYEDTGFLLFGLTLEDCPVPFFSDLCWADVFLNTIVEYKDDGIFDYKVRLPLFHEGLKKILNFSGITYETFQKLMTSRSHYSVANRTYGMRRVLKFVTAYNIWAKFRGLTVLRAHAYKDKRLIRQCNKFLEEEKLLESDDDNGDIKTAMELRSIAGMMVLENLLEPVDLPVMVPVPDENYTLISNFFTDSLEKLHNTEGFSCLEKVRPGIKDKFIENAEYNMVNAEQLHKNWRACDEDPGRMVTDTEFNSIHKACQIEDGKEKSKAISKLEWEIEDLTKAMKMKSIPKGDLKHTRSEYCDGKPAVEKKMRSGVVKTVRKKGGSCTVLEDSGVGHEIEYPIGMVTEHFLHKRDKRTKHLKALDKNKKRGRDFVLKVIGLKDQLKSLELDVVRKDTEGVKIQRTKDKKNHQNILLNNTALVEGKIDHVSGFSAYIRKKFVDFVNKRLIDGSGYHMGYDFKMVRVKYLTGVWTPGYLINSLRERIMKEDFFEYTNLEKEYMAFVGVTSPLNKKHLYNNIIKGFNNLILKRIRNRKSFTRLMTLSDEEKANIVLTLTCRDFSYVTQIKKLKDVRATEVRRILSCLERKEPIVSR